MVVTGRVGGDSLPPVDAIQPAGGGERDGFLIRYDGTGCETGGMIFADGLESGDLSAWSEARP